MSEVALPIGHNISDDLPAVNQIARVIGDSNVHLSQHAARSLLEPGRIREVQGHIRRYAQSSDEACGLSAFDMVGASGRSDMVQRSQLLAQPGVPCATGTWISITSTQKNGPPAGRSWRTSSRILNYRARACSGLPVLRASRRQSLRPEPRTKDFGGALPEVQFHLSRHGSDAEQLRGL